MSGPDQHEHVFSPWSKTLFYTQSGRFDCEARVCPCGAMETRNMTKSDRPAVITPAIGVFAGIFNWDGKLLIRKRPDNVSSPGKWELPGGGLAVADTSKFLDERSIFSGLAELVRDRVDILIPPIPPTTPVYAVPIKGASDLALACWVGVSENVSRDDTMYVCPADLPDLGDQILSGPGKRMWRMILLMLANSPNPAYRKNADEMLAEIWAS